MHIRILGSAAGGGLPQWNCNCRNCKAARKTGAFTSQSSAAVSADGKNWLLLNASPDLGYQVARFPPLSPRPGELRGTPIRAVILTDGEMDHTAGLICLREQKTLNLVCTRSVKALLTSQFPLLPTLSRYCQLSHSPFPTLIAAIRISAHLLDTAKSPPYSRRPPRPGDVVALKLQTSRRSLAYIPGLPAITKPLDDFVAGCDCLLVDGTFWSADEMTCLGLSKRTAHDMGHLPISGAGGTLEWLRTLGIPRRIYTHINNTNPILRTNSPEHRAVIKAGIEISHDGMDIHL